MNFFAEHIVEIISVLFGVGGVGYAFIDRALNRKKYTQEVRQDTASANIRIDEFWKNRYEVLTKELKNKDDWWKARYDKVYEECQNEKRLSNEIVKSFRVELNQIREDYEKQRDTDRQRYDELMSQYHTYQQEVEEKSKKQIERINQLEQLVANYEKKLKIQ